MSLKFELNLNKTCQSVIGLSILLCCIPSHARPPDCPYTTHQHLLCQADTLTLHKQLKQLLFTTNMTTNAPTRLIQDTQLLWQKRVEQCKTKRCIAQQFDARNEDLNTYGSLNQSLTQHFIKYQQGQIAQPQVHLQVHQLDQNRIKIEGTAYRNPNNNKAKQTISFLAYRNQDQKNEIINNETACKYTFNFQKAILTVSLLQTQPHKYCDRFVGTYQLYD